jgi:hypothetical protein
VTAQFAVSVGKLDITWRTSMGEMGRLQTSQLPRKVNVLADCSAALLHDIDLGP